MARKLLLIVVVALLLCLPSLSAIKIVGARLSPIIYEPGKTITNHYVISEQTTEDIEVVIDGELAEYVTKTAIVNNEFDLVVAFPEKFISPGTHYFSLTVRELPGDSPGAHAITSIGLNFIVEVFSSEKLISASLQTPSISEGEKLRVTLRTESRTYRDIDKVYGLITILDNHNQSLGRLITETKPLPSLKSQSFMEEYDASALTPGEYTALADVFYDGKQTATGSQFNVGARDLLLRNYTTTLEQGFDTFSATVANKWGKELTNVYLKLFMNNVELLHTPSTNIPEWEEGVLSGIVNIDFPPGSYQALLQLFFEEEMKEEQLTLTVVAPDLKSEYVGISLTMAIVTGINAFILIAVLAIVMRRKLITGSVLKRQHG